MLVDDAMVCNGVRFRFELIFCYRLVGSVFIFLKWKYDSVVKRIKEEDNDSNYLVYFLVYIKGIINRFIYNLGFDLF